MKSILRILVIVALCYLVYSYWKKNYSEEGILIKKKEEETLEAKIQARAFELEQENKHRLYNLCSQIVVPSALVLAGMPDTTQEQALCKVRVDKSLENQNWYQHAIDDLGI